MLVAGVACGPSLAGTYGIVAARPSVPGWLEFNGRFLLMFVGLGVTSQAAFTPVTTITELLRAQQPPSELIGRALPMTCAFVVGASALLALRYRPSLVGVLAIVGTTALLVLLLGLNISILGSVSLPRSERFVLWEVFALLVTILGSFSARVREPAERSVRDTHVQPFSAFASPTFARQLFEPNRRFPCAAAAPSGRRASGRSRPRAEAAACRGTPAAALPARRRPSLALILKKPLRHREACADESLEDQLLDARVLGPRGHEQLDDGALRAPDDLRALRKLRELAGRQPVS